MNIYKFQILKADEYTHKYMKSKPEVFKEADIEESIARLKSYAKNYKNFDLFMVDILKKIDKKGKGVIEFRELAEGLKELGFDLTYQEEYTIMRYFDIEGNWKLSVKDLFEGLGGKKN